MKQHLEFLKKSRKRTNPSKSDLLGPEAGAHGKKGGSHKNPWRPNRKPEETHHITSDRPFNELHHNNNPLIVCFLDDVPNKPQNEACKQCQIAFPRRQPISPYNIVLSHLEKWYYPKPDDKSKKLPSSKFTTRYYCIQKRCITIRFPYYSPSLIEIPAEVRSRLQRSHLDLLKRELDYEV